VEKKLCTYHSESEVIEEIIRTLGLCKFVRRRGVDPHLNTVLKKEIKEKMGTVSNVPIPQF